MTPSPTRSPNIKIHTRSYAARVGLAALWLLAGSVWPAPSRAGAEDPGREIAPGVLLREIVTGRSPARTRLWLYLPQPTPAGKLPCILIAPAGSRLYHGMDLSEGDRAEHLPYVKAGFAVLAYSVAGPLGERWNSQEFGDAVRAFKAAGGGVANARVALDWAAKNAPQLDLDRVYAVGHSSAATIALNLVAADVRVRAAVAYAPACDVEERLGEELVRKLNKAVPGFREFLSESSPINITSKMRQPILLFHADDDANVKREEILAFAAKLMAANPRMKLVEVRTGGHYDSMIREGIPKAIEWINALPKPGGAK